jgi:hypothetical protein
MEPKKPLIDFLYADHERVASFLAQIHGEGNLRETNETGKANRKVGARGELKLGLVAGGAGSDRELSKEVKFTYDPLWINSRKLIDYIDEHSAPSTSPSLGQLCSVSGTLIAYDLSMLTGMMNSPEMEGYIASGIEDTAPVPKAKERLRKLEKKREASVLREFIRGLPLGIGFVLVSDNRHYWFSVKRKYLSLYNLDVPLKFPTHISGIWNVIGVVDAVAGDHVLGLQSVISREIDGLMPAMVLNMMQLTGAITGMFGRPLQAHGLSPLAVFRTVTL